MNFPSNELVEQIRKDYPAGCRVELLEMDDAQAPSIGTLGTVTSVDDTGSIHVTWDTGGSLAIVYGVDKCEQIKLIYIPSQEELEAQEYLKRYRYMHDEVFRYKLLSRLQMDCEYYLGYGNRAGDRLWAGNEQDHIETMKNLYLSFPDEKKPQWITLDDISEYERAMLLL